MPTITLETQINAPIELCFDLARNAALHPHTVPSTEERLVYSPRQLLELGDEVTFSGKHFGIRQQVTGKITAYQRPDHFRDEMKAGIFKSFSHDHYFQSADGGTVVRDVFTFACPLGAIGKLADPLVERHMRRFLEERNRYFRIASEYLASCRQAILLPQA
jgi:ligand-binding SRPBCC domain-containing protein